MWGWCCVLLVGVSPSLSRPETIPAPVLKHLTGITAAQFARLVTELGPVWETDRARRLDRPDRQRAQGAGRRYAVSFAARLAMVLIYLRWNISYRALGGLFGVSKDAVKRAMDELLVLLAEHGITAPDGRRLGDDNDLVQVLAELTDDQRAALVDGTFVPVRRPGGGWDAQKQAYNPHKHRHAHNFQAITDDRGRLLYVGGSCPGSVPDLTALAGSTAAGPLTDSGVTVIGDKAYLGMGRRLELAAAFVPQRRRRPNQTQLGPQAQQIEREFNLDLARQRVPVEHAFGRLKVHRILHGFRLALTRFDHVINALAALVTLPA